MSNTLTRLAAIKALRRAHSHAKWGVKDLTRNKRLTAGLDGTRVGIYPDLDDDLGDPLWTLKDLIP